MHQSYYISKVKKNFPDAALEKMRHDISRKEDEGRRVGSV